MTEALRGATKEEEAVLRWVAKTDGWEIVLRDRALILDQARLVGEITDNQDA